MSRISGTEFSAAWAFGSMALFVALELLLGVWVGGYVATKIFSAPLGFMIQGVLSLLSYFVGGIFIGVVSPGIRVIEPAVGAFLSVTLVLSLTLFTPYAFLRFSLTALLVGGGVAFGLSLLGARLGERLTGQKLG